MPGGLHGILSFVKAKVWNFPKHVKKRRKKPNSSNLSKFEKICFWALDWSYQRHAFNAPRLDRPSFLWLLPKEVDFPPLSTVHWSLLRELCLTHLNSWLLTNWSHLPSHGSQVRRNLSSTHKSIRRIDKWFGDSRSNSSPRIQNLWNVEMELWLVSDSLHMGNVVHE